MIYSIGICEIGGYLEKLWIFYIIQENAMDDLKFFIINSKKIISEIFLRIDETNLKVKAYMKLYYFSVSMITKAVYVQKE